MPSRSGHLPFIWGMAARFWLSIQTSLTRAPSGRAIIVFNDDDSFHVLDLMLVRELVVHSSGNSSAAA
ncbi:MAG: hypothetical protein WD042_16140 [Phycisphaeraceae bacterium]